MREVGEPALSIHGDWPRSDDELIAEQEALGAARPPPWRPPRETFSIGGCFVCFARGEHGAGACGDPGWAGASVVLPDSLDAAVIAIAVAGRAGAPYQAGLLAAREGPLLEAVVRQLPERPDVLLVNATGRDHPRRAGLALHLGAVLDLPTVGVTHRPLFAAGEWPELVRGARAPLLLDGECVGFWLCTRDGARPLAVHAGWRTDPETALDLVRAVSRGDARTPEPLRRARWVAREARTFDETGGRLGRPAAAPLALR